MKQIPIALQLYSVRDDCARDLPGTVKAVAETGYEGVEFAGYYGRSAKELRAMVDDVGLKVAGTHIGLDSLLGDEFERTVEFNATMGNRFLIVPGLAEERRNSIAAWQKTAELFNQLAAKAKSRGMKVGYHNHWVEFQPMEGQVPWDVFFGATVPDVVMQIDLGNAMHGGAKPVPYLEKYPGRATTVHLKEYAKGNDKAVIGEGDVRWEDVFRLCETVGGTEWYIVEQESYAYPPLECVARCLRNLRAMGWS